MSGPSKDALERAREALGPGAPGAMVSAVARAIDAAVAEVKEERLFDAGECFRSLAVENEKLRAQVERLTEEAKPTGWVLCGDHEPPYRTARGEAEWLRRNEVQLIEARDKAEAALAEREAEVERLRGEIAAWASGERLALAFTQRLHQAEAERDAAREEVQRLAADSLDLLQSATDVAHAKGYREGVEAVLRLQRFGMGGIEWLAVEDVSALLEALPEPAREDGEEQGCDDV